MTCLNRKNVRKAGWKKRISIKILKDNKNNFTCLSAVINSKRLTLPKKKLQQLPCLHTHTYTHRHKRLA